MKEHRKEHRRVPGHKPGRKGCRRYGCLVVTTLTIGSFLSACGPEDSGTPLPGAATLPYPLAPTTQQAQFTGPSDVPRPPATTQTEMWNELWTKEGVVTRPSGALTEP
jgi:hypothetical protein